MSTWGFGSTLSVSWLETPWVAFFFVTPTPALGFRIGDLDFVVGFAGVWWPNCSAMGILRFCTDSMIRVLRRWGLRGALAGVFARRGLVDLPVVVVVVF
ncbi:hypothetical protein HOY82DRAFT_219114 [Tuber indicum]|nr:hypothetical protein HOY82DRAFT_219114 [Tuber indicum]